MTSFFVPILECRDEIDISWREVHLTECSELRRLLTSGMISEEIFSTLISEIDAKIEAGTENFRKKAH
jgi:hypothetical protein